MKLNFGFRKVRSLRLREAFAAYSRFLPGSDCDSERERHSLAYLFLYWGWYRWNIARVSGSLGRPAAVASAAAENSSGRAPLVLPFDVHHPFPRMQKTEFTGLGAFFAKRCTLGT